METLAAFFTALAGESRVYTRAEAEQDLSWNLYWYRELRCAGCPEHTGLFMREVLLGVAGSTYAQCPVCAVIVVRESQGRHHGQCGRYNAVLYHRARAEALEALRDGPCICETPQPGCNCTAQRAQRHRERQAELEAEACACLQ